MALLSWIQGAAEGGGKALATLEVTITGAPNSSKAHVEIQQEGDGDDDQLFKRHVAAGTMQAVPTTPTVLVSATCKVRSVFLSNISANILEVSVRAITGSIEFLDSRPMAPGEVLSFQMGDTKCAGGIEWNASGVGIVGSVRAYTA